MAERAADEPNVADAALADATRSIRATHEDELPRADDEADEASQEGDDDGDR